MSNISVAELLKMYGSWIEAKKFASFISEKMKITERHAYTKIKKAKEKNEILKILLPNRRVLYGLSEFGSHSEIIDNEGVISPIKKEPVENRAKEALRLAWEAWVKKDYDAVSRAVLFACIGHPELAKIFSSLLNNYNNSYDSLARSRLASIMVFLLELTQNPELQNQLAMEIERERAIQKAFADFAEELKTLKLTPFEFSRDLSSLKKKV